MRNLIHRLFRFFALLILFTTLLLQQDSLSAPSKPQNRSNQTPAITTGLAQIGQIGGGSHAVTTQGNYVYAGIGPRFSILEITDMNQLQIVGQTQPLTDMIKAVAVSGTYAYVSEPGKGGAIGGIHVIDISRPEAPIIVNTVNGIKSGDLVTDGDHLYATGGDLRIFDISDSPVVQQVGSYPVSASDIVVQDSLAYLTRSTGHLIILDVSNPSQPSLVSDVEWSPNKTFALAIDHPYVYIADGYYGLKTFDVSDPAIPIQVAETSTQEEEARDILVADGYANVAVGSALTIYELQGDGALNQVGSTRLASSTWELAVWEQTILAAASNRYWDDRSNYGGIVMIDVADHQEPITIQSFSIVGHAEDASWDADYIYAVGAGGLHIVNATDLSQPTQVSLFDIPRAVSVDTQTLSEPEAKTFAYVGTEYNGLYLVDVTNPVAPSVTAIWNDVGYIHISDVIVEGQYAYLGIDGHSYAMAIINISDPSHPQTVQTYSTESYSRSVKLAKQTDMIYLASGESLYIIDVADPNTPTQLGVHKPWHPIIEVAVQGDRAFAATQLVGIDVIDVSQPSNPASVGNHRLPESTNYINASNGYVVTSHFMPNSTQGRVYLTDFTEPSQPITAAYFITPGVPRQVAFRDDIIAVPDAEGGLTLLQLTQLSEQLFLPQMKR